MAGGNRELNNFSVFNLSSLHGGIKVMAKIIRMALPVSVDFLVVESWIPHHAACDVQGRVLQSAALCDQRSLLINEAGDGRIFLLNFRQFWQKFGWIVKNGKNLGEENVTKFDDGNWCKILAQKSLQKFCENFSEM